MCEWLSCGDWCDVRLMCEGRSFNAHRAVLASVSSFLRRVLLSCPVDESPVVIFLPEFDLDAVSLLLYYIYNGEVLIPNDQFKMFIDTANAMEIFIDKQFISQADRYERYCYESRSEIFTPENNNVCEVKLRNRKNGCFVNFTKCMRNKKVVRQMHESVNTFHFSDNLFQTFSSLNEENVSNLGNLTTISGCRQRQSYLRDIFIEAYSQDDNVNGQTPGVLTITNEEYRSPTSVLHTNVNEKCPSLSERFSHTERISNQNSQSPISNYFKEFQNNNYKENNNSNIKISYTVCNQLFGKKEDSIEPQLSRDSSSNIYLRRQCFLDLDHTKTDLDLKSFENVRKYEYDKSKCTQTESSNVLAKVTILNEVLQSPWQPRQPGSYRPYRKKVVNLKQSERNHENKLNLNPKDKNNNGDIQLKTHIQENDASSADRDLKCTICQEVFPRSREYNIHMRRHSSVNRYNCGECQKTFSQLRNYKYHMSVHRGTKEFAATCTVCGKHFNDKGYLSNHMKIHRNRKEYKCASCPKSFNQRVAFNMHVRIHTGLKPHVCEECGKAFSRKMLLKQHQRTHSGERPYACAHCDKRFADRSNMTLHLRLHTGVKPFSCTLCPKAFTKKHHLKSHLNFHTGAKPYSCPRCKVAFTQSSNMRTHMKKCNVSN